MNAYERTNRLQLERTCMIDCDTSLFLASLDTCSDGIFDIRFSILTLPTRHCTITKVYDTASVSPEPR